jgi:hypothetical protein
MNENRAKRVTKSGIPHHPWFWPNPKKQTFNHLWLFLKPHYFPPSKPPFEGEYFKPFFSSLFDMSGINPIPPNLPIPSNSSIFPSTILADELYKCANPPPSYQSVIGSLNANQSRSQCGTIIMAAPFGGSLSQVFPCNSTQLTMEPPPAYSRNPPQRNSMEGEHISRRKYIPFFSISGL